CRFHRYAEPLAYSADCLELPSGQGRVRRETLLAQRLRGPPDPRGSAALRPHRATWEPESLLVSVAGGSRQDARRPDRRRLPGPRAVLPVARVDWPGARGARAARRGLRSLARPGPEATIHPQPVPL